jgi:hypothetical protein
MSSGILSRKGVVKAGVGLREACGGRGEGGVGGGEDEPGGAVADFEEQCTRGVNEVVEDLPRGLADGRLKEMAPRWECLPCRRRGRTGNLGCPLPPTGVVALPPRLDHHHILHPRRRHAKLPYLPPLLYRIRGIADPA